MHMRRLLLFLILCCAPTLGHAEDLPKPITQIKLQNGDAVVFLGDSITHQCLYTQYVEDFFFTRLPKQRVNFHNAGVSGDKCADALVRFDGDIAAYKPKVVTILLGMNDGTYRPFDQQTFDTYERDMTAVVDKIKATGATPVVMTPTMFDARAARLRKQTNEPRDRYYNSVLAYYGSLLREMADTQGLGFVDMYGPLNELTRGERSKNPEFTMIADAVHPDAPGQAVMAVALLDGIGVSRIVSLAHVDLEESGLPKIEVKNGKSIMVESNGQKVSFAYRSNALPWVLPADAEIGYRLTRAGHRLSKEGLRVTGLPTGTYTLTIDGQPVGDYTADALSKGIELQGNAKSPMYQQALEVAMLNEQRNNEAVRPIRDLWLAKKIHRYSKEVAQQNPSDKGAADRLAEFEKKTENFDEKLATLEAKSKELLDKIYVANQPKPHRFELTPQQPASP